MSGAFQVLLGIGAVLVGEHAMGIDDGRWRVSAESAQVFVAEGQCGGGQEVLELGHRARPMIGALTPGWCRSHAMAIWGTVASSSAAMARVSSTRRKLRS